MIHDFTLRQPALMPVIDIFQSMPNANDRLTVRRCPAQPTVPYTASSCTSEVDVEPAELKFDALQRLAQRLVVVADVLLRPDAERQREVRVCLLPVVVRPDRVHPQHHLFALGVLQPSTVYTGAHVRATAF